MAPQCKTPSTVPLIQSSHFQAHFSATLPKAKCVYSPGVKVILLCHQASITLLDDCAYTPSKTHTKSTCITIFKFVLPLKFLSSYLSYLQEEGRKTQPYFYCILEVLNMCEQYVCELVCVYTPAKWFIKHRCLLQ